MSKSNERMDNPKKKRKNFTFHKHQIFLFYFVFFANIWSIHPYMLIRYYMRIIIRHLEKPRKENFHSIFFFLTFVNFQFFFLCTQNNMVWQLHIITTLHGHIFHSGHFHNFCFCLLPSSYVFFSFGHIIVISLFFHWIIMMIMVIWIFYPR